MSNNWTWTTTFASLALCVLMADAHALGFFRPENTSFEATSERLYFSYRLKNVNFQNSRHTIVEMTLCNETMCTSFTNPPKLTNAFIDDTGRYVIGLSLVQGEPQHIFVWGPSLKLMLKKSITCQDLKANCLSVGSTIKKVLWYDDKKPISGVVNNHVLTLRLHEFPVKLLDEGDLVDIELPKQFELKLPLKR